VKIATDAIDSSLIGLKPGGFDDQGANIELPMLENK
jgi:hypothetical protein